jgi:hypothetical protein
MNNLRLSMPWITINFIVYYNRVVTKYINSIFHPVLRPRHIIQHRTIPVIINNPNMLTTIIR